MSPPTLEEMNLGYSFKNIPIGNQQYYFRKLYEMASRFINNIRWKTYWSSKDNNDYSRNVFPSRRSAPPNEHLVSFENDFFSLLENIEFRKCNNRMMEKIKKDLKNIKDSKKVVVFADKSSNIYKIDGVDYKKMLHDNVTKTYRKATSDVIKKINEEAAVLFEQNLIKGKIPKYHIQESFVTIKDHKPSFPNKIECRLINPSKSYLGKISKQILDKINNEIRAKTNLIQWKNTDEVIEWFNKSHRRTRQSFIKFDIVNFYPSITKEIMIKALDFSKQFIDINEEDMKIIIHSCKTILSYDGDIWVKKDHSDLFDIPMGSLHGAEVCELVGLFLLDQLKGIMNNTSYGIYRDDGLAITNKSKCEQERLTKAIRTIFGNNGFKITIEHGLRQVDFLDVKMDIFENRYMPFSKPNSETIYVSRLSNHPNHIKKQIPSMINKRLSRLSKFEQDFNNIKKPYEDSLRKSSYSEKLEFIEKSESIRRKRKRKRKIIYFHPPFSMEVKTKIGSLFLKLIKKHFTPNHPLHKILNHKSLKLSYSCLPNVKSLISSSNNKILQEPSNNQNVRTCNCNRNQTCPMNGNCLQSNLIYKATIKSTNSEEQIYIGSAGNTFKERYGGHKNSFTDKDKRNKTELSKHYWKLIEQQEEPIIHWSIEKVIRSGFGFKNGCALCNTERYIISRSDQEKLLNTRKELTRCCPHYKKRYFPPFKFDQIQ